ncbi:MAG TPA: phytanoyl-CoA dioxygenase family protein, partial [Roseimicrobium sp.]|nr:phytanoyl-CoA dioxygenase family protein [Roseimicrobium sp.]
MKLPATHHKQLIQHGFTVIPNALGRSELRRGLEGVARYFPSVEELEATPERYGFIYDDPENLQVEFPFADDGLNDLTTDAELIRFVQKLLGTDDIRLAQSAIWAKYAGLGHYEQGLHLDYQGNTLVVPRDDADYRQVNMILYYTDVTVDLGPTHVVSATKAGDLPLWPTHRWRKTSPALYEKEQPVIVKAGSMLVFSMRTWHRASAMTAEAGVRFSHHYVWRSAAHDFQGYHQYSKHGENEDLQA